MLDLLETVAQGLYKHPPSELTCLKGILVELKVCGSFSKWLKIEGETLKPQKPHSKYKNSTADYIFLLLFNSEVLNQSKVTVKTFIYKR